MAKVIITDSYLSAIGSAIRSKNGQSTTYKPSEMAAAIQSIPAPSGSINISSNGTVNVASYADAVVDVQPSFGILSVSENGSYSAAGASVDGFSDVVVDVPNSYSAADEGKVLQSGVLVAQSSQTFSSNGTYDTTTINEAVIDLPMPSGSINISANGEYDVTAFSGAVINVPASGITPAGSISISSNGTYDVTSFAEAVVDVPQSGGANENNYLITMRISSGDIVDSVTLSVPDSLFKEYIGVYNAEYREALSVGASAFAQCSNLETISMPKLSNIGTSAFYANKKLQYIDLPSVISISTQAFDGCKSLSYAILPMAKTFGTSAFRGCEKLKSVYLLSNNIGNITSNVFFTTPIASNTYLGEFGSIYVLPSMVDTMKAKTGWSVYADRITAYVE